MRLVGWEVKGTCNFHSVWLMAELETQYSIELLVKAVYEMPVQCGVATSL